MGKHLQSAFAEIDPGGFARLLGQSADAHEMLLMLDGIFDGMECSIVAHLAPDSAERLLSTATDIQLSEWIETASIDDGRRLLGRLGRERAARVISSIGNRSRRRDLRRLSGYPPGSIGELAQFGTVTVSQNDSPDEVESAIGLAGGSSGCPVIVTRRDGGVLGMLDVWRFVQNRNSNLPASELTIPVEPLHAGTPVESARLPAEWNQLTCLPVVDHQGRPIGFITRTALERAGGSKGQGSTFLGSVVELVRRFWLFLSLATVWILDRRLER